MKFKTLLIVSLFALTSVVSAETATDTKTTDAQATNTQAADAKASMDPKMQEAWAKASTPGEEHKMLEQYVGNWNHSTKWWMTPNATPETSTGSSQFESIFGGRFLKHTTTGTSMGQPFEGMGLTGYDNVQKHFTTVWLDNMGTGIMVGEGKFDSSKNAIVDQGSFSCPMTPSGKRNYRSVMTLPKNNTFTFELYSNDDTGKEFRMMEITYTKAQA